MSRSWSAFVECDRPIRITGSYLSRSRADRFWNRALVIMADSLELCSSKLKAWKAAMEKGLRVNMSKTKFLISGVGLDVLKDTGKFSCAVCRSGVGNNSIQCSMCKLWVHKRCSSLKGRLVQNSQYACPRCLGNARPIDGRPTTLLDIDGSPLEVISTFPYLGDTLNAGGGCDSAIAGRCCAVWGKFRKLLPLLSSRHISPKSCGQVYSSCVRSAMLHGSETWGPNASEQQRLRRNDRYMVRWICGMSAHDDIPSDQLLEKLGLADITTVLRCGRLRWAGHVEHAPSNTGIGMVGNLVVPGKRGRGRPRKTWAECVKTDVTVDCQPWIHRIEKLGGLLLDSAEWEWPQQLGKVPHVNLNLDGEWVSEKIICNFTDCVQVSFIQTLKLSSFSWTIWWC